MTESVSVQTALDSMLFRKKRQMYKALPWLFHFDAGKTQSGLPQGTFLFLTSLSFS